MKQFWLMGAALLVVSCGAGSAKIASLRQAALDDAKRTDLTTIGAIYDKAPWHLVSIEKVAALAAVAPHNARVFPQVADLMSRCGFQTQVLLNVAEAAARSRIEVPAFSDLAELSVLKLSGTVAVVDLADQAAKITDPADLADLDRRVADLRAGADCKTVDEAIARVDALLRSIDSTARR